MKQNKKDILNKLKDGGTGFSTPKNYFVQFESNLRENKNSIKSGFTAPEDYFDHVEESILLRLNMKVNRSTGFNTPDNYFENIDHKILVNVNKKKPEKIINLITNKYLKVLTYSIAASLLIFFSLKNLIIEDKRFDIETIEISEIESWMDDELISFSSYEISETFDDIYLTGEANYTQDEILDYLNEENIENLIIEN